MEKPMKKESECGKTQSSGDISKYFQKTNTSSKLKSETQSASVREPGTQPMAKRLRNDENTYENMTAVSEFSLNLTAAKEINKRLYDIDNFLSDSLESSALNDLTSTTFTSIKSCQPVTSDLSNWSSNNQCTREIQYQSQQLTNDVRSSAVVNQCMNISDDMVIPPTPPPLHTFKSKNRISVAAKKFDKTKQMPGNRNYKHIKKQSISLSRTSNHSNIMPKKVQSSKRDESLKVSDSIKENLLSVNNHYRMDDEKIDKISYEKTISNSSFKLARKKYKLSRKGKKPETEKSLATPLNNKKSEPDHSKLNDDVKGNEKDILLSYGVLGKESTILKKNQDLAQIDDCESKESRPRPSSSQTKTRRKLSLNRDKNSKLRYDIIREVAIDVKHEASLCDAQDKMPGLEKVLTEPAGQNDQDMLDISLNSEEISQLMNGDISWSPIDVKKSSKKLVSHAPKQYVRNQPFELNSLVHDSTKLGYRRFLVLERQTILEDVTAKKAKKPKIEKVNLRLFDESDNSEAHCELRGEWRETQVEAGDIVNIIGNPSEPGTYILDNEQEKYIIVYPDILVTPTSISTSTKCLRRSILDKYFKTEGQKEVMFLGTLLHRIFEASLIANDFSAKFALDHAKQLLQQPSNLTELYGLGITEDYVLAKVSEFKPFITDWGRNYFTAEPHPVHGVIDFKDGGMSKNRDDTQVALCVSKVLDIEECIWSPKFGLKGQIDSSVEVKINRKPNIMKKDPSLNQTCVLPLELKTGKHYTRLGSVEHRAQVILYTLMMMERYENTIETGLLLYLKTGHMLGVPAYNNEKQALIMKRNELIRYLSHASTRPVENMPGMLKDEHNCKYCSQLNVCTLYHKSVENGDSETAGMGKLFDKATSHLSGEHLKYFSHWNKLIALESKATQEKRDDAGTWRLSGTEREDLGYCFSKMSLVSSCVAEEPGRYLSSFKKEEFKLSRVRSADMHLLKGDYVVVSQEDGVLALATGFLKEISEGSISVLTDKDLTQNYHHRSCSETEQILYRIDKAEISTFATLQWSSLAKLFFPDSEEHAKLRRLIVDLESPKFSQENEMISSISSIQVSEAWSSQLSSYSMTLPVKSSQDNSELSQILQGLNSDQTNAIRKVFAAQDYVLILGCPGAGKTHTIACLVRALVSLGKSVLLTSYTHSAVDNILLKLTQNKVDFLRLGSVEKVHPNIKPYVVGKAAEHINTVKDLKDFYESKSVVATTCLSVNHAIFNQRSFDYCIVDEASQITQPVCIGSLRHASIFVLVGDDYQLTPLVQSDEAREAGMDISLFERLSECHPYAVVQLEYQYRMHKHIMLLSNTIIYENRLKCGTSEIAETLLDLPYLDTFREKIARMDEQRQAQFTWLLQALDPQFPVLFINTDLLPAHEVRSGPNVYNEHEAGLIASITHGLIMCGLQSEDIGVISPYKQQVKVIKQHLSVTMSEKNPEAQLDVEIDTVDKYQGRDKLCVVVSLVRSNAGGHIGDLLRDWRRVNVALTRAKQKLILLGSRKTLIHNNVLFQELLALLEKKSWIHTLPKSGWRGLLPW